MKYHSPFLFLTIWAFLSLLSLFHKTDLFGGYQLNQKFSVSTKTDTGVAFTVNGVKKDDKLDGDAKVAYKGDGYSADVKLAADSKVTSSVSYSKLAPGLKVALNGSIPDKSSGKLSFDYIQDLYTVKGSLGLTSAPKADVNVSVGHGGLSVGAEAGYCTKSSSVTKWSLGAAYAASDYKCAVLLADKGEAVKASYVHAMNADTSIGTEVVRKINKESTTFTIGGSHKLENGAQTKVKIDNLGIASILYEQDVAPKTKAGFTLQFDSLNLNKAAKVGMAFDIKA
jgi:voltage-dependent anion channel protein 2